MKKILILGLMAGLAAGCFAGDVVDGNGLYDAEDLVQGMSTKLNRGFWNVLTGWGEIPRQMIKSGKDKGWWAVVPVGVPAGAMMTVVRTGVGVFEGGLFFVPIDDSFGPIIDPAFVWQKKAE